MFGNDGYISASEQTYCAACGESSTMRRYTTRVQEAARQLHRYGAEIASSAFCCVHLCVVSSIICVRDGKYIILALVSENINAVARPKFQGGCDRCRNIYAAIAAESDIRASCSCDKLCHDANICSVLILDVITLER